MPPKKNSQQEKKQKQAEDKTFGLKNKNKSKKVQQYVQQVQNQAKINAGQAGPSRQEIMAKKKQAEAEKLEMQKLLNATIIQPKVPFGVDPKTMLCAFFKAGQCQKGDRCKYSHDLNVGRKTEKKNLYQDDRTADTMDKWDQAKLEQAINERESGAERTNLNKATEIVCKHFLEAVENEKYGWFWECVNGVSCKYRHALPPGFVLKKKETEEERKEREAREKSNQITIEDLIEKERKALGADTTPVTEESFLKWKTERLERKQTLINEAQKAKQDALSKLKSGFKNTGMVFSGRDMFEFNADWAGMGDDDEGLDIDELNVMQVTTSVEDLEMQDGQ